MATKVLVLAGTRKGAFVYTSDARRQTWEISEPILPGWTVYHMTADFRGSKPRLLAAANHWAWGPSVARSDDMCKTWEQRSPGLAFPADMEVNVDKVWHLRPGNADEPGVVYAGTQPAGLFRSEDGGDSWAPVDSLNRHEYRPFWMGSGGGDSCLHSLEIHPNDSKHMYASISTGGTYVSHDHGGSWDLCSHRIVATNPMAKKMEADFAEKYPEIAASLPELPPNVDPAAADEFHKLRIDPKQPERLWGQAHIGVFRSDNGGARWDDVTQGLPSFHGFPLAVTKRGPDAVFIVPLAFEDDNFRVARNQFAVYRTRDAGTTWERLTDGLPGPNDYQSVYREGLDTDGLASEGVYVGTSNGQVFASADAGDHWQRLPGTLPPVLSISAAVIED